MLAVFGAELSMQEHVFRSGTDLLSLFATHLVLVLLLVGQPLQTA